MRSAGDMQIAHDSAARTVYLNHTFPLPLWAQAKSLKDYRTTFHIQNCQEGAKRRFSNKRDPIQVGNAPEKREVYCIKLILDTVLSVKVSGLFQCPKL